MSEARLCPHCGTETPADAPEGLCPECLLQQAMGVAPDSLDGVAEPRWFYVKDRQKVGPVPLVHLRQLAARGALRATDMLLPHGASKWVPAGSVMDLSPVKPGSALATERLEQIGRYQIEKVLGQGGFGVVYRAYDDELHRQVAIKVPLRERVWEPEDAEAYLTEARTVASLDHPHIVPVFDVGRTEDGLCFVVSKFIEGSDLAQKLRQARFFFGESAALVAVIAEALHYAHCRWLVHRDIKPANILIDTSGKPYLTDFGVALKEGDIAEEGCIVGTPAYMSPEQISGEGHRIDGRSDIFSLGVVLYEMLTGGLPFASESMLDLLMCVVTDEPPPPRQVDDTIPTELERICLKALAKRASERYTTALAFADDLRHWQSTSEKAQLLSGLASPLKIVPKGLRSFDASDTDFFLELLPGPRDRDGLPDSLRFWKNRIEEKDTDQTFRVGLIYGPSGCGKSSLVKAGLLPRLADSVVAIYIEATGEETETRLLKGLRKRCPGLPADHGLTETLALLRRGQGVPSGKKVLLVMDQFEQWLHSKKQGRELVQALRQCDGQRVQAILMVRDDFWMAATRFMKELEIAVQENHNLAAVDLFGPRHTKKVLRAFGQAFGVISAPISKDQDAFLNQAVAGLAQDDKIISVRLALFAEMVKGKPWTPATLKAVGGTEGVGVAFLEETFFASTAPPQHRLHRKAAQGVLKVLLPEAGTDIKGHMRSRGELLAVSGYSDRPDAFEELLRILDGELRLITPTDLEGGADRSASDREQYFQLTHDYLVHSLRDWLTRKQKETRRGRAELLLADRAAVWNARPENRQLPSLLQWWQIRRLTRKPHWTPSQQKMMRQASRYHGMRSVAVAVLLLILSLVGWEGMGRWEARNLRDRLLEASTTDVPGIVKEMATYRRWVNPLLREAYAQAEQDKDRHKQLHASLALLPVDPGQMEGLYGRLLEADAPELMVIRGAMLSYKAELSERMWPLVEDRQTDPDVRFRAACALAVYTPDDPRWEKVSGDVAERLVSQNAFVLGTWANALRPVGKFLLPPLASSLADEKRTGSERSMIATLYKKFAEKQPNAFAPLEKVLAERNKPSDLEEGKIALVKRKVNVGLALIVMGQGERAWPLLKHSSDPTLRTFLIDRLAPGGVEAKVLLRRFEKEDDVSIKRAILLSLGEFGLDRLPTVDRQNLIPRLVQLYRDDPDPGIHGIAEWLLQQWGAGGKLKASAKELATGKVEGQRRWYITGQGQTMVVIAAPGECWIGEFEERHKETISRSYALAASEVTIQQYLQFRKVHKVNKGYAGSLDCPVDMVSWFDAVAYCNWLNEQEGIPRDQWCYGPNKKGEYAAGMTMPADYLDRTGYRLPTEAEWEYACRANAYTPYSFGKLDDLLGKYAWFAGNSDNKLHPVGTLRPNDLGLFGMLGNAREWCQNTWVNNKDAKVQDTDERSRVSRGGSFIDVAAGARSIARDHLELTSRQVTFGFRPARTVR